MPRPARSISRKTKPRVRVSAGGPAAPCDSCTVYRCGSETEMRVLTMWSWCRNKELPECKDREPGYWERLEAGQ